MNLEFSWTWYSQELFALNQIEGFNVPKEQTGCRARRMWGTTDYVRSHGVPCRGYKSTYTSVLHTAPIGMRPPRQINKTETFRLAAGHTEPSRLIRVCLE